MGGIVWHHVSRPGEQMSHNATAGPLGHGIHCIDAGYIRPGLACFYLVHRGGECAVIETGTSHSLPRLLSLMDEIRKAIRKGKLQEFASAFLSHYPNAPGIS